MRILDFIWVGASIAPEGCPADGASCCSPWDAVVTPSGYPVDGVLKFVMGFERDVTEFKKVDCNLAVFL